MGGAGDLRGLPLHGTRYPLCDRAWCARAQLLVGWPERCVVPWRRQCAACRREGNVLVVLSAGNDGVNLDDTAHFIESPNAQAYGRPTRAPLPTSRISAILHKTPTMVRTTCRSHRSATRFGATTPVRRVAAIWAVRRPRPQPSGVAALLFSAYPGASAAQVRRAIIVGANHNVPGLRGTNEANGLLLGERGARGNGAGRSAGRRAKKYETTSAASAPTATSPWPASIVRPVRHTAVMLTGLEVGGDVERLWLMSVFRSYVLDTTGVSAGSIQRPSGLSATFAVANSPLSGCEGSSSVRRALQHNEVTASAVISKTAPADMVVAELIYDRSNGRAIGRHASPL